MPVIDINLLSKQQGTVSRLNQANFVVAVVAGVVIGLQLLIVVFLYSTIGIRTAEKSNAASQAKELQDQIAALDKEASNPNYKDLTLSQQAGSYQTQVATLGKLIDTHRYFSLYISEVAQNTPSEIVYQSFGSDSPNRLTITGIATSYGDVARLSERFKGLSFAKNATLQEAKLSGATGGAPTKYPVSFSMVIDMKSAAELNKLPGPIPKTGQTAASPAPRPSAGPSPQLTPGTGGTQ